MTDVQELYVKIADRAEKQGYDGDRLSLLMDIESADKHFGLDLEGLLNADNSNFNHDITGIINNIDRSTYPATNFNFFVPRCTRKKSE